MMIETTISGLSIGIYPIEDRPSIVKEFFSGGYMPDRLNQNLSHAASMLALCQHTSKAVGIDLEISPAPAGYMGVAKEFFWPDEFAFLQTMDYQKQANFFLALWTAKEAHCKLLRSNIHDGLPGHNFVAWLKSGCPSHYQYTHGERKTTLLFKTGIMDGKKLFLSVSL